MSDNSRISEKDEEEFKDSPAFSTGMNTKRNAARKELSNNRVTSGLN